MAKKTFIVAPGRTVTVSPATKLKPAVQKREGEKVSIEAGDAEELLAQGYVVSVPAGKSAKAGDKEPGAGKGAKAGDKEPGAGESAKAGDKEPGAGKGAKAGDKEPGAGNADPGAAGSGSPAE